jgi:signal-transduction protein with cAMP-binding, CBS, and nucleotidyltransferase domain
MLSVERVKQLANDPTLSDKQIEEIRDGFYMLSQVIFEQWQAERNKAKEAEQKDIKKINNQNEYEKPTGQQQ